MYEILRNVEGEAYEAEKHLILGTKESATFFAQFLFEWYLEDSDVSTAPYYIARATLGYLVVGNIRDAKRSLLYFTEKLAASPRLASTAKYSTIATQQMTSTVANFTLFSSIPLLNFYELLILTCQRKNQDLFRRLRAHYKKYIEEAGGLDDALDKIGEKYFDIRVRNQSNMLQDLMGSLFSGSSSGRAPQLVQIQNQDLD